MHTYPKANSCLINCFQPVVKSENQTQFFQPWPQVWMQDIRKD